NNRNVNNGFATLKKANSNNANGYNNTAIIPRADPTNDFATDIYKSPEIPVQPAQRPTHHTIDDRAILTWQYPINYPKRDYQYNIIRRALFTNTLVSLPTGLGKTFIAAVVMLNYFRWFPNSKIVFMAPTRPLVNQQIEACFKICGIPQNATMELTGQHSPALREQAWKEKQVFFCTPQILNNDLKSGLCPARDLVCLVVDEAHRATGNYAYAQVIRELEPVNRDVRVLALSATPGSDIKAVQKVVTNLKIAKIESRTEDSMDLQAYVFKRNISEIVVPCGREIAEIRDKYARMIRPHLERLMKAGIIWSADPAQLSRFSILQGKNRYIQDYRGNNSSTKSMLLKTAQIAMGLVAAYELLCVYGIWPFFVHMDPYSSSRDAAEEQDEDEYARPAGRGGRGGAGSKHNTNQEDEDDHEIKVSVARKAMEENPDFRRMMDQIRDKVKQPNFISHPKMERLVDVVTKHFTEHQDKSNATGMAARGGSSSTTPVQTRVMIFANYRETVDEIGKALEKHRPLIKIRRFIGQATAKGKKGISQKEQQKVVADFQRGEYNVLVATSIGEEGLDIGDVDLIVCYDSHSSPIRMLQRMGRTGRKRAGKICLLLAEGQEEGKYRKSQSTYKSVQRAITQGNQLVYYPENPKIIPGGQLPTCDFVSIDVPTYITTTGKKRKRVAGDDEPTLQTNRLRTAYLDPEEQAQFHQRYWLSKNRIRKITFEKACATMLSMKRSTMVPDKTGVVGHSTRTLEYIKNVNRMAKARVEQSLNGAMRSLAPGEPDPHTRRMLALLEKSKILDRDQYQGHDDSDTGRPHSAIMSFLSRNKKSGVYSHDSLDDDEMEDLGRRLAGTKTSHRRKVILSDSELEDHTTTDDGIGRNKAGGQSRPRVMPKPRRKGTAAPLKKDSRSRGRKVILSDSELEDHTTTDDGIGRNKAGGQSRPRVMPKPRRKGTATPLKKDSMTDTGAGSKSAGKGKVALPPIPGSIKSYFHTVSDDEVDREIMGGLDGMFGLPEDYQHYSREPTMSPLPQDRPSPLHELGPGKKKGFDFQESSTLPLLWYKTSEDDGSEFGQDDRTNEDDYELSVIQDPAVVAFVVFDIPPVPKAGQWFQSSQETPTFVNDRRASFAPRTLSSASSAGSSKINKAPPSPQEILLIESSEDEIWNDNPVEWDVEGHFEAPNAGASRDLRRAKDRRLVVKVGGRKGIRQNEERDYDRVWVTNKVGVRGCYIRPDVGQSQVKTGQQQQQRLWGDVSSGSSNNEFDEFGDLALTDDDQDLWD
ncbi:3'-5' DNA helicase, partial [Mortierella sp. 14UC]